MHGYLWRLEEGFRPLGAGAAGGYELSDVGAGTEPAPPGKATSTLNC